MWVGRGGEGFLFTDFESRDGGKRVEHLDVCRALSRLEVVPCVISRHALPAAAIARTNTRGTCSCTFCRVGTPFACVREGGRCERDAVRGLALPLLEDVLCAEAQLLLAALQHNVGDALVDSRRDAVVDVVSLRCRVDTVSPFNRSPLSRPPQANALKQIRMVREIWAMQGGLA